MPRAFDITPTTTTLSLQQGASAECSFTVSNKLGKSVRARATAAYDKDAPKDGVTFSIADSERELAHDGTATFTVKVTAPPNATVGTSSIHLSVASTSNPDEDFAQSAPVSLSVTEHRDPPFPWWIVAVAAGVLVLSIGGFFLYRAISKPAPGAACQANGECPADQTCVDRSGAKTCLLKPGEACESGVLCASGTCRADTKTCARSDGGCDSDAECTAPSTCINKVCRVKPGATCPASGQCPVDQACVELESGAKVCLLKGGQPCESPLFCASSFCRLDTKTCSREDQGCDVDGECQAPSTCIRKKCLLKDGMACELNDECDSAHCDTTKQPAVCGQPQPDTTPKCSPITCRKPFRCVNDKCVCTSGILCMRHFNERVLKANEFLRVVPNPP